MLSSGIIFAVHGGFCLTKYSTAASMNASPADFLLINICEYSTPRKYPVFLTNLEVGRGAGGRGRRWRIIKARWSTVFLVGLTTCVLFVILQSLL